MDNQKHMYAVYHMYDTDGGFGDAIPQENMVGIVMATEEEINAFVEKWDKPEVYDRPYADLYHHIVRAEKIDITTLEELRPYSTDEDS